MQENLIKESIAFKFNSLLNEGNSIKADTSDPKTKDAIPLLITNDSPHTHLRWSWATVERAWKEAGKGKLPLRPRISQNTGGQSSVDSWYRQL